jgi:hypothetical protein
MGGDKKLTLPEFISDKNITFIIISILFVYALERFAKSMHTDLVAPTFQKCLMTAGWDPEKIKCSTNHQELWKKLIVNTLELTFSIIILFLLSRFIFGHTCSKFSEKLNQSKSDKRKEIIVYFKPI